jgi:hypothetical protein
MLSELGRTLRNRHEIWAGEGERAIESVRTSLLNSMRTL